MKKYYKRQIDIELESWATSNDRKPLLLRGARQVGKTSAVRHLGDRFKYFAQIDFNERHDVHYLFRPWLETDAKALLVPYGRYVSILHVCCFVSLS